MSDLDAGFELVEFEQVQASPDTVLLRVAGQASPSMAAGPLTLVLTDGPSQHAHEQLPALPAPPGMVRAAFSAPAEQLGSATEFSLRLPDGQILALPSPTVRLFALNPGTGEGPAAAEAPPRRRSSRASARLVEAERRAESRRLAITDLEQRLQGERERRATAETEVAELRSQRDEALAGRDAALADRDEALSDRDQAEARARAAAANAGALQAQLRAAADASASAQSALEAQLTELEADLERMRTAAEVAQARAHASRRDAVALDEQLAHAQGQISVLQRTLDQREAEREAAILAMDEAIASARAETLLARRRVTSLEEQIAGQHELVRALEEELVRRRGLAPPDGLEAALAARAAEIDILHHALEQAQSRSGAATARADAAEAALAQRTQELERDRAAASLAAELEARNRDLAEAVRTESEKRIRAEETLVAASAQNALRTELLVLEANRRYG